MGARKKNPISPAEGRRFKRDLGRDNEKTLREKARAKVRELRTRIKAARARGPLRTKEVAALVKRTRALLKLGAKSETAADVTRARRELEVERADQATQARLEKANRQRRKDAPKKATAKEHCAKSDGEVEGNVPPEFVHLWRRVKRSIKGNDRKSRTEAFLEYVAENPGEVIDAQEAGLDAHVAELEARANSVHQFSRKRSYSAAELSAPPF